MIQSFVWIDTDDSRVVHVHQHTTVEAAFDECEKYKGNFQKVVARDSREACLVWNLIGAICPIPERSEE